jgi:nicotinamide-nucleotide amidase
MSGVPAQLKSLFLAATGPPKLAVAESMTGGRVQARIVEVSGASEFFLGGVTTYSIEQKVKLLGVDRGHALAVNGVSGRVAGEMASGACRLFGADFAVATTGYAEPALALGVSVPFGWVAVARISGGEPNVVYCERVECPGATRIEVQTRVADAALAALVARLRTEAAGGV